MNRNVLICLILVSSTACADINGQQIGQTNNANNGFSNAAVSSMSNTQVNMSGNSQDEYGNGVKCGQTTLNIAPYIAQSQMDGDTGQTAGIAVGVSIPLGDGTCQRMARNLEHKQRTNDRYEQIKLCIELQRNHVTIDQSVDPDLYQTCRGIHYDR